MIDGVAQDAKGEDGDREEVAAKVRAANDFFYGMPVVFIARDNVPKRCCIRTIRSGLSLLSRCDRLHSRLKRMLPTQSHSDGCERSM